MGFILGGKEFKYGLSLAPMADYKPPLCKGRWHGNAVTEGL